MKYCIICFLLITSFFISHAQCKLVINGHEYASGDSISKEELSKACDLSVKTNDGTITSRVVLYQWVLSFKGQIFKGAGPGDCAKLRSTLKEMSLAKNGLIFFNEIKCRDTAKCNGQYVLNLK